MTTARLARATRRASRNPVLLVLARAGFAGRALLYAVIALLSARIALGDGKDARADKHGALESISQEPFGRALVLGLAGCLAAYALWRLARAAFPMGADDARLTKRLASAGSGLLYVGVAFVALRIGIGEDHGGDEHREADLTATALALPLGRFLVAGVGVGMLAASAWSVRRALLKDYRSGFERSRMSAAARRFTDTTAAGAFAARAVADLLLGVFLLRAVWQSDAHEATGLDGVLRRVGASTWGSALLLLFAAGFLARAVYGAFEARYRKVR
jgi:hypothetical protein